MKFRQEGFWNMEDIKVSAIYGVLYLWRPSYNQAEYIKDAINSFLMQKTNFSYEIIIHDDASTDGTIEVLKYYEKKVSQQGKNRI